MIPWSHDTSVENQHSRHAITWPHREKQKWTKAPQDKSPKGSESRRTKPPKMRKIFYDSNNQGVWSHDHMIQVWRINILVMPSRGRTEKSKNGQKHHRTKAPKDQNQGGQNSPKMRKYFKTPTIKVYDIMITWYRCGQSTFSSCHHVAATEKSKNGKKHHITKARKDQNQGGENPQKWENILRLQQSRCTIPWSHDTGVDNQHSHHAITWPHREKQKWTKAPQVERAKGSESRRTKPPKMRKYFKTPTIKVYDLMITLYRCGQ